MLLWESLVPLSNCPIALRNASSSLTPLSIPPAMENRTTTWSSWHTQLKEKKTPTKRVLFIDKMQRIVKLIQKVYLSQRSATIQFPNPLRSEGLSLHSRPLLHHKALLYFHNYSAILWKLNNLPIYTCLLDCNIVVNKFELRLRHLALCDKWLRKWYESFLSPPLQQWVKYYHHCSSKKMPFALYNPQRLICH